MLIIIKIINFIEPKIEVSNFALMARGRGTGVAGVARATPKIGDLYSKIFENSQNLIFLITRATPR